LSDYDIEPGEPSVVSRARVDQAAVDGQPAAPQNGLEQQMAALAAQVHGLSASLNGAPAAVPDPYAAVPAPAPAPAPAVYAQPEPAQVAPYQPPAPAPAPVPAAYPPAAPPAEYPPVQYAPAPQYSAPAPAVQPVQYAAPQPPQVDWPAAAAPAPAPAAPTQAELLTRTAEDIVVMAERAATEIRENALREAERIRAGATIDAGERVNDLRALIQRQRESLAALSAETDRVEQSSAILRAQARALAGELDGMLASVDAAAKRG
jgi:hypothetical protein